MRIERPLSSESTTIEVETPRPVSDTSRYFDQQASAWSQKYRRRGHFRERLDTVLEWFKGLPPGMRLLDYGCGSGVLLAALARMGHQVVGVDASPGMLARARLALDAAEVPRESAGLEQVGEDFEGEYLKQTYDGIICLGVIEYLDNPNELLRRLSGRLDPAGRMILSFPNRRSILRKVERFVFKYPFLFRHAGLFTHLTAPDSYLNFQKHQFTVAQIERFLGERGLVRGRIHYHSAPRFLDRLARCPAVAMTVIAEFTN
jgi:SAM-dependent methyltransferase